MDLQELLAMAFSRELLFSFHPKVNELFLLWSFYQPFWIFFLLQYRHN